MGRPARVLFLNSRSEYGGADMGLLTMVRHFDKARIQPYVVLPHPGPLVPDLQAAGAAVRYMDICRLERLSTPADVWTFLRRGVVSLSGLLQLIRREGIDLVYTNSSAIPVGALAARLTRRPHIWHVREIWSSPGWLSGPLYRYVYAMSDRIIAISHAVAGGDFGRVGGKIVVIYDGIDFAPYAGLSARAAQVRESLGLSPSIPLISSVARFVPQKGLDLIVEAARRLRDAGSPVHVCLAGDIPRPRYASYKARVLEMVRRAGLEESVHLLGWIEDAPALLAASDVVVLASRGPEGAGLIIPEAWLAGAPVVVPAHSGPAELVVDGETGLVFRFGDAADLAEKVADLLSDAEARRRMAEAGRKVALERHDARRNTAQIAELILELVERRPRQ